MMISTKGRYALRIMLDLAQHETDGYISLKSVSERQAISLKYLELVIAMLHKANLVDSMRGKEGGYRLSKDPSEYSIGSILKVMEKTLALVACMSCGETACSNKENCLTLPLWQQLDQIIDTYLESVTLKDLLDGNVQIPIMQNA